MRDLNSAESALHSAQKELDTASEVLEEALAAAAVVQVSAPALEREDIETLQRRYDDAVREDHEANELLDALDPSHTMASVAASAKNAADPTRSVFKLIAWNGTPSTPCCKRANSRSN